MIRYIIVSLGSGLLFGVLDALINAYPLAVRLFAVYKPIARTSINPLAGVVIDLVYGFAIAGVLLAATLLRTRLDGWLGKGIDLLTYGPRQE